MENNKGILLETGTNEFEIIEFAIGNISYGINVAKVREVINSVPITPIAQSHKYIDGAFVLRGKVMPLINLARSLNSQQTTADTFKIIVCEINNYYVGFKVDEIYRIHRIYWTQMEPVPPLSGSELTTGIIKMKEHLIVLLDFERILSEVNPEINKKMQAIPATNPELLAERKTKTILVAEDSKMLRDLLIKTLQISGYNTISTNNGQEAWDKLESLAQSDKPLDKQVQLVITDIEMPQIDGHHLTKRIKESERLKQLPVIIFSSLINDEVRRKGEALGACAQITKPEIEQLINVVDLNIGLCTA